MLTFCCQGLGAGAIQKLKVEDVVKECLQAFPWLWASAVSPTRHLLYYTATDCDVPCMQSETAPVSFFTHIHSNVSRTRLAHTASLIVLIKHQAQAGQDHNSQHSLIITLITVLHYATLSFMNMRISAADALNEAYRKAPNVLLKLTEWVAASTAQADDIVTLLILEMNIPNGPSS
ncbi:hypothetical protein C8F04DRAFT_1170163 [Mycena alexandri]|uniref:Uncharacterized protein n=1 Tax=Mycena alexandri TaxID=1745969 RepID=A0AAD6RVC0_9AGAR|nr:hypothetical protein C8F04DRAFT_1170163 [Mycena alexandri]